MSKDFSISPQQLSAIQKWREKLRFTTVLQDLEIDKLKNDRDVAMRFNKIHSDAIIDELDMRMMAHPQNDPAMNDGGDKTGLEYDVIASKFANITSAVEKTKKHDIEKLAAARKAYLNDYAEKAANIKALYARRLEESAKKLPRRSRGQQPQQQPPSYMTLFAGKNSFPKTREFARTPSRKSRSSIASRYSQGSQGSRSSVFSFQSPFK